MNDSLTISLDGDELVASMETDKGLFQKVRIPASVDGLRVIKTVLKARRAKVTRFASDGAPTQARINEMLKAFTETQARIADERSQALEDKVRALGVDLSGLGL